MMPSVPYRWAVQRMSRAIQWFPGVSCMHPTPIARSLSGRR